MAVERGVGLASRPQTPSDLVFVLGLGGLKRSETETNEADTVSVSAGSSVSVPAVTNAETADAETRMQPTRADAEILMRPIQPTRADAKHRRSRRGPTRNTDAADAGRCGNTDAADAADAGRRETPTRPTRADARVPTQPTQPTQATSGRSAHERLGCS